MHFSHDQDWMLVADGKAAAPDTLWQWAPGAGGAAHLLNQRTRGHLNYRPGGFGRGHADSLPATQGRRKPAPAGKGRC